MKSVLGLREGARAYVFDSHRPLDLENANPGNQDVLVMRDDKEGEETFPEPDSDGSDSDDEDDDDDEEAGGMSPRTRRLQRAERQRERASNATSGFILLLSFVAAQISVSMSEGFDSSCAVTMAVDGGPAI